MLLIVVRVSEIQVSDLRDWEVLYNARTMIRRIFLFVLTNIAIIVMGTIILGLIQVVFGIDITGTLHSSWLSLAIFALIYGFF